jgi:hypothetical protein
MGDPGFELVTTLTVLHRDEVREMFSKADGADGEWIREQEAAAMFFLHEDDKLVVELSRINHGAPPRPCGG